MAAHKALAVSWYVQKLPFVLHERKHPHERHLLVGLALPRFNIGVNVTRRHVMFMSLVQPS